MSTKLTWADLMIEDSDLDQQELLQDWEWTLKGPFTLVAGSKFGDWFIERPDGKVEMLDLVEGVVRKIAPSRAEFERLINTQEKQEEWLLSVLVHTMHEKGVVPVAGQCYSFKVPPVLGGKAQSDNVEVTDLKVWISLCGQLHHQLQSLPPGTKVSGFTLEEE